MDVSTRALRGFVVLHEERHFGRAAARLRISTPSLSEQVARLEQRLGTPLFERTSRSVHPTAAADELLALALAVLAAHDDVVGWALTRARPTAPPRAGTVRVGVVATAGATLRRRVLAQLRRSHPQLRVSTRRLGFGEEVAALREERVDVLYAPEPLPSSLSGIRWARVARSPRVLVVASGHHLARREGVRIAETDREVFVTAAGVDERTTAWWLVDPRADGSSPRRGPLAADLDEVLELCAAGEGVNIAAAEALSHGIPPGLAFVEITDVEPARVALLWRRDDPGPAVTTYVGAARALADLDLDQDRDRERRPGAPARR